jgi:hypothetical protein
MLSGNLGQPSPLIAIDSGCSHSLEELAHQDDSHSSDIKIEAPKFNQYANLGIRSIANMIESALEDRVNSKTAVKTATPIKGVSSVVVARSRWANLFTIS